MRTSCSVSLSGTWWQLSPWGHSVQYLYAKVSLLRQVSVSVQPGQVSQQGYYEVSGHCVKVSQSRHHVPSL